MIKFSIYSIGSLKSGTEGQYLESLIQSYVKKSPIPIDFKDIDVKQKGSIASIKKAESMALINAMPKQSCLVLLDEKGKSYTSQKFSEQIDQLHLSGFAHIIFAIGGAHGHDHIIKEKANLLLSLSNMTWPHQMVRLLITEQIYRAQMIAKGHPYHKE